MRLTITAAIFILVCVFGYCQDFPVELPAHVGVFEQQVHRAYAVDDGLPDNAVTEIGIGAQGRVVAVTAIGGAVFNGIRWQPESGVDAVTQPMELEVSQLAELRKVAATEITVRAVATHDGEIAVAADAGLFVRDDRGWRMLLPKEGDARWAPVDVRAVTYDAGGRLWFAAPQGVGFRVADDLWELFTAAEGLPFNDFTCMAAGPKGVWFGTTNGAIHFRDGAFAFRQGRRWLLDNHVRDIAVDADGNAWIATAHGVSCIAYQAITLAQKAAFYESEIEKYHRRTSFGYVNPAVLESPGDKSSAKPEFTDNDGHGTGLYLTAMSLAYAATRDEKYKDHARNAFRALAFLSEVTQGGTHPAPKGFIARAIRPTSESDPNPQFDIAYDLRRKERDALWKVIQPRWPIDETGEWYWKNDSSSDELDGHFLGFAAYYDHVCETEAEKDDVRHAVRRIIDHILDHGYNLVDYDGQPTRWGRFSPDDLNRNEAWVIERGLNSLSILTYLSIAHHITGDPHYREEYLHLALDEGYAMNGMTQPKDIAGPGTFGQPDDFMALMNFYHLIRYETDPKLLSMYYHAIRRVWQVEQYERSAFANFVYAACCHGKIRRDQWGETDLSMPKSGFDDAIDTLKRYPLDLIDWPMSNAHRIDIVPLQDHLGQSANTGHRVDGYVFPIDERTVIHWDRDPWTLTSNAKGTQLRDGTQFLLAYYMGRAHAFIGE